jgi:hypothetical protein
MRVLALVTVLVLSSLSTATAAFARGSHMDGGGMGHVGGMGRTGGIGHWGGASRWSGRGWHGPVGHVRPFTRHRRFFAFGFGSYFGYPYDADYGDDDCWQWRPIPTRSGSRWRPVNVCYGSYY